MVMSQEVRRSLDELYGSGVDQEAFDRALETSLDPRGPDMLFDMVARLALPSGAAALDLGCRDGRHTIELARRFGLTVHGIDPLERHISRGRAALAEVARQEPEVASRVRLSEGRAERIEAADGSVDLIWCRDVLVHVEDLVGALRECGRVLSAGGHMLVYQMFATGWLEPKEAERLWPVLGVVTENTDPRHFEEATGAAGLRVVERAELRSEWREHLEEDGTHRTARQLLYAARLLRAPERFIAEFGNTAYEFELGNCLWGVYQMIGKLSPRVYLLAL
jgi:ubiquinone/menaquinone biosynthesis C-methylase UbiE